MPFSDIARSNMLARSATHTNKVGSLLFQSDQKKYPGYEVTDCITFVLNVLKETYVDMGNEKIAHSLVSEGLTDRGDGNKFYGDLLARYLVLKQGWSGIYIAQDQIHPSDGSQEHTFASAMVKKHCRYTNIPVAYTVVNYNPTPKSHPRFGSLYPYIAPSKLNSVDLNILKKIKFGFGISRSGDHTWLFSEGYIYEVHWNEVGSKLYDKTEISKFKWQSGLIVVPPDANAMLTMTSLSCARP